MQRVVGINLNGNAYQLEENGYNALFAYLDATEAQLKDDPNRAQLLAALEERVAEQCNACLNPHKTIVTSLEIDRIIALLGPVHEQPGPNTNQTAGAAGRTSSGSGGGETRTGAGAPAGSGRPYAHRRLFQIRDGSMISGVCMGLAEFLHIDVTFIRILFLIFALVTAGWGVLAYGVLMFIVPRVQTRAEAASAQDAGIPHRWPWDDGWPWDRHGWPWDRHGWGWDHNRPVTAAPTPPPPPGAPPPPPAPFPAGSRSEWRAQRRAERMHYGAGSFWGFFGLLSSILLAFFWLSLWTRGHFFFGWPFFWGFPHWIGIIIFFMVIRMIFMPFRMARWYGYGYGPYAHPHHAWAMMWNGLAWFIVMIFAVWFAYHYLPEVHDFIRSFQTSWKDGDLRI